LAHDLFTAPTAESLAEILVEAGVDLGRSGYTRSPLSHDGVGITIGARGESEPDLPQVHFAREPIWPVVARRGGQTIEIGGFRPDGWPLWIVLGDGGHLEITGPAQSSPSAPPWAIGGLAPEPFSPVLPDWRRAFEGVRP